MLIKLLFSFCPNYYERISTMPLGKIFFSTEPSSFVFFFLRSLNPYANEPSTSSIFLGAENIGIIDQISNFGKALEEYHPGKIKTVLNRFAEEYEEFKENLPSLEGTHTNRLEEFEKIYNKLFLKIQFSKEQKDKIEASFNKFSQTFKALINTHDAKKLKETYALLDAFNETVMQSHQLYIGLDKVVRYIESNNLLLQTFKEQLHSIILLKEQFNPNLEGQGFNQITKKAANRARLLDLIADVNTVLKTLIPETNLKTIGKNDDIKNELLKTILQESEKVVSFMQESMGKHRKTVFKKIRTYLNDETSSFEGLQQKLELLPKSDKKSQDLLLDLKKMRFYLKDDAPLSSCSALKEKLGCLLKEQPYLFTKREKIALVTLLEKLSVISNGKHFNKEDLQERLNQCREIIKELAPKETIFLQITTSLSKLGIFLIKKNIAPDEHKRLIDLLNEFTKNPKISFKENEKEKFLDLKEALSFDPSQPIPEEKVSALQPRECLELVKKIAKRPPSKKGNKLAIEQELQKLAKHATNLSFMMFIDKTFFHSTRDSLFYLNIIQKSEELKSCPKQLFLDELKMQGFSTWKIVSARVCFFVAKRFKIESYIHKTISRTISSYSKMIYQKLDQESTHHQFHDLSQKIVENATIYFHLLSSSILNAKKDAQRFPNPEQITILIVNQLLLSKLGNNEAPLEKLNLNDLYSKLIDDLVERSESSLLKWIVSYLDKPALISSIIETGIDSLIKPDPNGNASTFNLLIRDGLRILYKKLNVEEEESQKEQAPFSHPLAEEFAEKLMSSLNEYRDIQQMASSTKIAVANANHMRELRKYSSMLDGMLDQSIENYKQIDYNVALLADFRKTQMLKKEKDREALFVLPVLQAKIKSFLNTLDRLFPQPSSESTTQKPTISVTEVARDKTNAFIRGKANLAIKEKVTLAITKLLETHPSEEALYDWIYQGLVLTNQAIEQPKEKQDDVKKEITELLNDISVSIANTVPATIIKDFTKMEGLSSKLAGKILYDVAELISPVIQGRLQAIVDLATEKALYQPELLAQLGRRIILPTTAD